MELIVQQIPQIQPIEFNYSELRQELIQRTEEYKTVAYTADTIKQAKADRSSLNKLKKALNDERIRLEKEFMQPFADFKSKVTELVGIVDEAAQSIDKQVKEYETLQREEKTEAIKKLFKSIVEPEFPWMKIEQIWDAKWLNATCKVAQIEKDMADRIAETRNALAVLGRLNEYAFEAQEEYKWCLNLEKAIAYADKLKLIDQARKEQELKQAAAEPESPQNEEIQQTVEEYMPKPENANTGKIEPQRQAINFRVYVTLDEAMKLSHFMKAQGIAFERI